MKNEDEVYVVQASGEGSVDYRVCRDKQEVRQAYVDLVCGSDDPAHKDEIDGFMNEFNDPDEWEMYSLCIELYCASVTIYKMPADLFAAPVAAGLETRELVHNLKFALGVLTELTKQAIDAEAPTVLIGTGIANRVLSLIDEAATVLSSLAGAREAALEEAAMVCDLAGQSFTIHNCTFPDSWNGASKHCAQAIRALAAKE